MKHVLLYYIQRLGLNLVTYLYHTKKLFSGLYHRNIQEYNRTTSTTPLYFWSLNQNFVHGSNYILYNKCLITRHKSNAFTKHLKKIDLIIQTYSRIDPGDVIPWIPSLDSFLSMMLVWGPWIVFTSSLASSSFVSWSLSPTSLFSSLSISL